MTDEQARQIQQGIVDEGEILKAAAVVVRKVSNRESHLTVTLTQGKNREIRRMFKAIGHEVTALKRIAFGSVELGTLQPGQWREIIQ